MWTTEKKLFILLFFAVGLWPIAIYFWWRWGIENRDSEKRQMGG